MQRPNSIATTILLSALVALGPISTDLYLPSLPGLARGFGVRTSDVQLTLSVFLIGLATAQLIHGPLSDRFGRRPVLLAGLCIYVIASLICMMAPAIHVLIAARFAQAIGACVGPVLGRAVVRDIHGREGAARVLSYLSAAMALAPAVGPILGGFLEVRFGWQSNFLALAIYGGLGLLATFLMLPETNRHPDPEAARPLRILAGYRGFLGHRAYLGYMLCCSFAYCGIFAFISGSSFVFIEVIGLAPDAFGFCFAAIVIGYIIGTVLAGRLSRRYDFDRLIAAGSTVAVLSGLLMLGLAVAGIAATGLQRTLVIVAPMLIYMIGIGLVLPNSIAGAVGPFARAAGAASALLGFTQMSLAALTGIAVAWFHNGTSIPMTAGIAAAAIAAWLSFRLLVCSRAAQDRPPAGPA